MGGLFSKPKQPKVQPPTLMPVENSQDTAASAERRRQELAASQGRESTDLTPGTENLGR